MGWRIDQIINQMGGYGLRGAFAYIGASQIQYKERADESKPDASKIEDGFAYWQTGLMFRVNGKRGWRMLVTLEPSDTYTVRLLRLWGGKVADVLDERTNVYCDTLQRTVEAMYDRAVEEYMSGFIPIG